MKVTKILTLFRFRDWIHYLGFIVLGLVFGGFSINLFILLLTSVALLSYAFSLNEVYDKGLKTKLFLWPLVISIILLIFLNLVQILFALIFIIIMTMYSYQFPRLKSKPIICTLCNAVAFPCLFAIGFFELGILNYNFIYFFSILLLLSFVIQLIHELSDIDDDKINGVITTAIKFEEDKVRILLWLSLVIIMIITTLFLPSRYYLFSLILFIFYFVIRIKRDDWHRIRIEFKYIGTAIGIVIALSELLFY